MTPETLEQLRQLGISPSNDLRLEFFFYTNTSEKARQLATEIDELGYSVEHGPSAGEKELFIITGWTCKMKMSDEVVELWTHRMCDVGYKYDCEFDGWGTDPNQKTGD